MQRTLDQLTAHLTDAAPHLIGALVILIVGYLVARIVAAVVSGVVRRTGLGTRVGRLLARPGASGGTGPDAAAPAVGRVVFWLLMLFVLVAFFQALELTIITQPLTALLILILAYIPRLIGAAILALIAWVVATVVRRLLLAALPALRLDERLGARDATGGRPLTRSIAEAAFYLILLLFLPAILGALGLTGLLGPVQRLVDQILGFLPHLLAAALTLAIAYLVARVLAPLVTQLLTGIGFDGVPARLGLARAATARPTPSALVGRLVLVAIMLFAAIEALGALGFVLLAALVVEFVRLAGHVLLGLAIFAIGLYLARLAVGAIRGSGAANASLLAEVARGAILVLVGAMALREMGLAAEIITLAFGLTLGAIAVAAAIAFGVGGRQVAGRELERFVDGRRARGTLPPLPAAPEQPRRP